MQIQKTTRFQFPCIPFKTIDFVLHGWRLGKKKLIRKKTKEGKGKKKDKGRVP